MSAIASSNSEMSFGNLTGHCFGGLAFGNAKAVPDDILKVAVFTSTIIFRPSTSFTTISVRALFSPIS